MAIKKNLFAENFGGAARAMSSSNQDRPKAEIWLNIGYTVNVPASMLKEGDEPTRFINLATGIPVDTMEDFVVPNGNNELFRQQRQAQNGLKAKILEMASELKPGEDAILDEGNFLQIQIRRVREEAEALPAADNVFALPELKLKSA